MEFKGIHKKEDQMFQTLFQAMDDLVFVLGLNGLLQVCYPLKKPEQLCIFPDSFLHQHYKKILPRHLACRLAKAIHKIREKNGGQTFDYLIRLEGKEYWYEVKICGVYDDEDFLDGFIVVARNITRRKLSEKNLKNYIKELEEMHKYMIEREIKIVELREENEKLREQLNNNSQ